MQRAFILVNAEAGKLWKIADAAAQVKGVKIAHAVTGAFDAIIYAEVTDINELSDLINAIQSLDGVTRTQTAITIPPRIERLK